MQVTHIDYLGNQMSFDNKDYLKELNARFDISDTKLEADRIEKQKILDKIVNVEETLTINDDRSIEEKLESVKQHTLPNISTEELFTLSADLKEGENNGS